jgi:hypothetical protein
MSIFQRSAWSALAAPGFAVPSLILPRALSLQFKGKPELICYQRTWYTGRESMSIGPAIGMSGLGGLAMYFAPERAYEKLYRLLGFEDERERRWMLELIRRYPIKLDQLPGTLVDEEQLHELFKRCFDRALPRSVASESLERFPLHGAPITAQQGILFSTVTLSVETPSGQEMVVAAQ